MSTHAIVIAPNAKLETFAERVEKPGIQLGKLAARMRHIMHRYDGIGLAAPQIGLGQRLAVLELNDKDATSFPFTILINPEIVWRSKETDVKEEGCLSLPGVAVEVARATKIRVRTTTLKGKRVTLAAEGLFARALQHEVDHLDGALITKRAVVGHPLNRPPRVLFFATAPFALPTLQLLHHYGYPIVGVVTEPPAPKGRGMRPAQSPVAYLARELKLPIYEFPSLRAPQVENTLRGLESDIGVVAAYGKLIPRSIFTLPTFKTLNIHPSLLPLYRGSAPIQQALLDGRHSTGVSVIVITEKLDAGPMVAKVRVRIEPYETGVTLNQKLAVVGAQLAHATLPPYIAGKRKPRPQPKEGASYTKKLTREDGLLDFDQPPEVTVRQIRALQPWPGAYTFVDAKLLKILDAHLEDGKVAFDIVQLEGKKPVSFADFIRGWKKPLSFLRHPHLHAGTKPHSSKRRESL